MVVASYGMEPLLLGGDLKWQKKEVLRRWIPKSNAKLPQKADELHMAVTDIVVTQVVEAHVEDEDHRHEDENQKVVSETSRHSPAKGRRISARFPRAFGPG